MHEQDKPTREHLVARLAEVSHETWMRQAERDKGLRDLDPAITSARLGASRGHRA